MSATTNPSDHKCAICGKPVDLKITKTDGDGKVVHEQCLIAHLKNLNKPATQY